MRRRRLLRESNIQTYYHITRLESALDIVAMNRMKGTDSERKINHRISGKPFNICLSRNKTVKQGYGYHFWREQTPNTVYLTIDGGYINSRYKIKPFDYLGASAHPKHRRDAEVGRQVYRDSRKKYDDEFEAFEAQNNVGWSESEERLYSDNQYVNVGDTSIVRADIITNWEGFTNIYLTKVYETSKTLGLPKTNYKQVFYDIQHYLMICRLIKNSVSNVEAVARCVPEVHFYLSYEDFNSQSEVSLNGVQHAFYNALNYHLEQIDNILEVITDNFRLSDDDIEDINYIYKLIDEL